MSSNNTVHFRIDDTEYSVRIVRRMKTKGDKEIYHMESYRESSFLAKAFVYKLSTLNLCDKLKIPISKLPPKERATVYNSVIDAALMLTTQDGNPSITDSCEILFDDQTESHIFRNGLTLYRARNVDYAELISLAFDILPGVSDLLLLESLAFPVKRALNALNISANYTFFLSMPYCSLKTSLLKCLSSFALSSESLIHKFTDYANVDALLLSSQEYYGLNFILDDVGNKGLFRTSSLDRRREDLDNIITFNADHNERSNIILCAEEYQNLGRLSTYSRLLIVSHDKPDEQKMKHMIKIMDKIQGANVCAFYLDFYNAIQEMAPTAIEKIVKCDDYNLIVKSKETMRIGRHTHVLYAVWNLLKVTLLKGMDLENYTQSILQHLQAVVNNQQAFEKRMQGISADPVCLTLKLIEGDYLKKYNNLAEFEKASGWQNACFIDKFKTEVYVRSEVLQAALRNAYSIPLTKNLLNKKLAQADVIKKDKDGRNVRVVNNKRYLIIDLNELKSYVCSNTNLNPGFNDE